MRRAPADVDAADGRLDERQDGVVDRHLVRSVKEISLGTRRAGTCLEPELKGPDLELSFLCI